MSVAIAIVPASPRAAIDFCRVNVTGAVVSDATTYNPANYPTMTGVRYYISAEKSGQDSLKSQVFEVAADGSFEFNSLIFPASGTWALHLRKAADDSDVVSASVTVQ